ncbi:MAG: redoxin domain-containing protein [Desulfobacterales bacterium]|nr:redoxin domain-containing protein [Desulfobacterales bacterium]
MKTIMVGFAVMMALLIAPAWAGAQTLKDMLYDPGVLKPIDSTLKVKVGQTAPDFTLPAISGEKVRLSQYRGKKNVVISFVPAAFTPVCSDQWPGYNMARGLFEQHDAILLGITVDSIPTLSAWLSDFWPHGAVASKYGLLRKDGVAERALIFIDKKGVIRDIVVSDINKRPDLEKCAIGLDKLDKK